MSSFDLIANKNDNLIQNAFSNSFQFSDSFQ